MTLWRCAECKEAIRIPNDVAWPQSCPECRAAPFHAKDDADVLGFVVTRPTEPPPKPGDSLRSVLPASNTDTEPK